MPTPQDHSRSARRRSPAPAPCRRAGPSVAHGASGRWRCQGAAVLVLMGLAAVAPARASQVRARNLSEMVAAAGMIFTGRVEAIETDRVHDLPVTRVTFRIEEGLRGAAGETVTLTFPGGVQPNGFPYRVSGLAPFHTGDRLVLLAYPASPLGLTSPVGLYQGRFELRSGPAGLQTVIARGPRPGDLAGAGDPAGATTLGSPVGAATPGATLRPVAPSGPVSFLYADFMATLRRLVEENDAEAQQ